MTDNSQRAKVIMDEESMNFRVGGIVGFIGAGNMPKAIAFPLFQKGKSRCGRAR